MTEYTLADGRTFHSGDAVEVHSWDGVWNQATVVDSPGGMSADGEGVYVMMGSGWNNRMPPPPDAEYQAHRDDSRKTPIWVAAQYVRADESDFGWREEDDEEQKSLTEKSASGWRVEKAAVPPPLPQSGQRLVTIWRGADTIPANWVGPAYAIDANLGQDTHTVRAGDIMDATTLGRLGLSADEQVTWLNNGDYEPDGVHTEGGSDATVPGAYDDPAAVLKWVVSAAKSGVQGALDGVASALKKLEASDDPRAANLAAQLGELDGSPFVVNAWRIYQDGKEPKHYKAMEPGTGDLAKVANLMAKYNLRLIRTRDGGVGMKSDPLKTVTKGRPFYFLINIHWGVAGQALPEAIKAILNAALSSGGSPGETAEEPAKSWQGGFRHGDFVLDLKDAYATVKEWEQHTQCWVADGERFRAGEAVNILDLFDDVSTESGTVATFEQAAASGGTYREGGMFADAQTPEQQQAGDLEVNDGFIPVVVGGDLRWVLPERIEFAQESQMATTALSGELTGKNWNSGLGCWEAEDGTCYYPGEQVLLYGDQTVVADFAAVEARADHIHAADAATTGEQRTRTSVEYNAGRVPVEYQGGVMFVYGHQLTRVDGPQQAAHGVTWRKSADDVERTQRGFIDDIAAAWDSDEALETMAIFADWLEDQGDSRAARYVRPSGPDSSGYGYPEAEYLMREYEETIHSSEPDVYPEITTDTIGGDIVPLDGLLNAIRRGYYKLADYSSFVFDDGGSQDYRTGAETKRTLFVTDDAGNDLPDVVQELILALTKRR